ncbi:DUF4124 domain-containing protein [Haliea sp. E17]|uniref:DUF4124 domain-containing protein n=1 Tax=Haliea sp. E17 TaxID=3401576 RepID=UPI003AB100C0
MRFPVFALLLPLALAALETQAQSQVYKTTDKDGNVVFTDQPPADDSISEKVDIPPVNTAPATAITSRPPPAARTVQGEAILPTVKITAPENETTIPMGGGEFGVFASVSPPLDSGQSLQLRIDGKPWGDPQTGGAWQLSNVFRGAHDLTVELIDSDGEVLSTSPGVRVYVMRPSVLN